MDQKNAIFMQPPLNPLTPPTPIILPFYLGVGNISRTKPQIKEVARISFFAAVKMQH